MEKYRIKALVIALATLIILCGIIAGLYFLGDKSSKKVEVMDLYGEIIPYQPMSYGDEYIAKMVFDSLIRVNNYELENGLAEEFKIDNTKITITLGNNSFRLPSKSKAVENEDILNYYNDILIKLTESNTITNPGIRNIDSINIIDNKIEFNFNSESPDNILALTERIGYSEGGNWYGTLGKIEYELPEIIVDNTTYINTPSEKDLQVSERISNMMLANVLADDSVKMEKFENGTYGFITWGSNSKVATNRRELIFTALEGSSLRKGKGISLPIDSIYSETSLYGKVEFNSDDALSKLKESNIGKEASLNIGVVSLGSFNEVENALTTAFNEIGIPTVVQEAELQDIVNSENFDIIYVRLARGKSPNITGLFKSGSLLDSYAEEYKEDIDNINSSKTWEELCNKSSMLEKKLREDGVWLFIDKAYDIRTTKK